MLTTTKVGQVFYRLEEYYTEECDVVVRVFKYQVVAETRCGVWITLGYGKDKFINLNSTKRWACPTIEQAKLSYLARKKRQIRILEAKQAAQEGRNRALSNIITEANWVSTPLPNWESLPCKRSRKS